VAGELWPIGSAAIAFKEIRTSLLVRQVGFVPAALRRRLGAAGRRGGKCSATGRALAQHAGALGCRHRHWWCSMNIEIRYRGDNEPDLLSQSLTAALRHHLARGAARRQAAGVGKGQTRESCGADNATNANRPEKWRAQAPETPAVLYGSSRPRGCQLFV
jgi:hypothetical protein